MRTSDSTPDQGTDDCEAVHLILLIPAFNEADTIGELIGRIPRAIPGIDKIEIVVIDDGSTDGTCVEAQAAGADVVRHSRNAGLATAFRTAVHTALERKADLAVTMDADLQFSPDDIPMLVEPILAGRADFVAGDRFSAHGRPLHMPWTKYQGNRLMTFMVNRLARCSFRDVSSGYRGYSREALLNLNVQSSFTYTQETFIELAAKGMHIEQVPVHVQYFPERRSYISSNLLRYGMRTFLTIARATRDYAPLSIFGTAAVALGAPGLLIGLFVLAHYIATGSFSPYIFLAFIAAYLLTLGFALLALALAADMLRGIRSNQERLLYFAKRSMYD